ncbi:SocA family protein [Vannielia litorea]|uniref:Panacea domain-containing protein n=1 Tax=Vannielia litorea TaxID=1217970 RepID=UPI001C9874A2|nr:Panacea domain-containing protein [Vannielia litorea]MBY6151702.1 SocA family protein [Vannielia litorea]
MTYDPLKAAQTIAFFAIQQGNDIDVLKAVKLVYLADRESLRRRGHPIQSEARVSMPHGPVNSTTLNYLNGAFRDDGGWSGVLSDRANHRVGLANPEINQDQLDRLSTGDIAVLETVWAEFGGMSGFELVDWTHSNIVEWQDPQGSSRPIPLDRMMAAVGLERPIERAREIESLDQASRLLASL